MINRSRRDGPELGGHTTSRNAAQQQRPKSCRRFATAPRGRIDPRTRAGNAARLQMQSVYNPPCPEPRPPTQQTPQPETAIVRGLEIARGLWLNRGVRDCARCMVTQWLRMLL